MEHAVIVTVKLSGSWFGKRKDRAAAMQLANELERALASSEEDEFDGDEYGGGECTYYMYGADADRLFARVEPILRASALAKGGHAIKRYGEASDMDAREERIEL